MASLGASGCSSYPDWVPFPADMLSIIITPQHRAQRRKLQAAFACASIFSQIKSGQSCWLLYVIGP